MSSVVINYRIHGGGMTLTMPSERRLESLIRLRRKVLSARRFELVSPAQKAAFFYDYLTKDLNGKAELLNDVLKGAQFASLSREEQSQAHQTDRGHLSIDERPIADCESLAENCAENQANRFQDSGDVSIGSCESGCGQESSREMAGCSQARAGAGVAVRRSAERFGSGA